VLNLNYIIIKNMEGKYLMNIGQKIKELRIQKSLTQEELADRAELSKGFISQLERDLTSPSIATLVDILQCLGTNLEEFFSGTSSEQVVFKKTDYFEKYDGELKNLVKWIIPNAQKNMMEPILLTLDPGGSTYPDNPHEGEEFGYIISGSIILHIGNRSFKAKKGESFYFIANKQHYITASEKSGASLLWISTPPSF
jgi:transcriptional regulator with XRE-family HTH domain